MNKYHVLAASLILGLAAIFGVAATTKTAGFGAAAQTAKIPNATNATIAARQHKLDRAEVALRRARADRPPTLPAVPKVSAAPRAQQLVYSRPAPVVVLRSSSSHGEQSDDHYAEREGGDD